MHAQQYYFNIDVRTRAKTPVAGLSEGQFGSVLLVNNCTPQPKDFGHRTKLNDVDASNDTIDLSSAARLMLFGLEGTLSEQMEDVQILDVSQNKTHNFYKRSPLSRQQADSLCTLYGVEAILSLNQLIIYDLQEFYLTESEDYYGYIEAYCSTMWVFQPQGGNPQTFTTADTLYWHAQENSVGQVMRALPNRQQALLDLALYSGEQLGTRFFPQWQTEERYLYANQDTQLEVGIAAFQRQQWAEAINTWRKLYDSTKDPLTRAYAAANAAVAAEMTEDYKQATQWAGIAENIFLGIQTRASFQQVVNMRYYKQLLSSKTATLR